MVFCCVGECEKTNHHKSGRRHFLRFHYFPKDEQLQKKWVARINRRPQDINTKTMRVCSEHFANDDYEFSGYNRSKLCYSDRMSIPLKSNAIPNTSSDDGTALKYGKDTAESRKRVRRYGPTAVDDLIRENEEIISLLPGPSSQRQHEQDESLSDVAEPSIDIITPSLEATCKPQKHKLIQCNLPLVSKPDVSYLQDEEQDCLYETVDDKIGDPSYKPIITQSSTTELTYSWALIQLGKLDELFKFCPQCGANIISTVKCVSGFSLTVRYICLMFHNNIWQSSPIFNGRPLINYTFPAATLLSGIGYTQLATLATLVNMPKLSETQFGRNNKAWLYPVIVETYKDHQEKLLDTLKDVSALTICGDGAFDSPGHSALTCVYTALDCETDKVIDFSVVRKGQFQGDLERQGCSQLMRILIDKYDLSITRFVTDQHTNIAADMRNNYPSIYHGFDIWHMARNLGKAIDKISKIKDCESIGPWKKSIINHFWWCSKNCGGNEEVLLETWHSVLFHIAGIHEWEGASNLNVVMSLKKPKQRYPVFNNHKSCLHRRLRNREQREVKYLNPQSKCYHKLFKLITDTRRCNAMRHCSKFLHTGALEILHNVKLKYLPKRKCFGFTRSVVFMMLVALETNLNANVTEKKTHRQYSRAQGQYILKSRYKRDTVSYKQDIIEQMSNNIVNENKIVLDIDQYILAPIPKNFHGKPMPSKKELELKYTRRSRI